MITTYQAARANAFKEVLASYNLAALPGEELAKFASAYEEMLHDDPEMIAMMRSIGVNPRKGSSRIQQAAMGHPATAPAPAPAPASSRPNLLTVGAMPAADRERLVREHTEQMDAAIRRLDAHPAFATPTPHASASPAATGLRGLSRGQKALAAAATLGPAALAFGSHHLAQRAAEREMAQQARGRAMKGVLGGAGIGLGLLAAHKLLSAPEDTTYGYR